jgi:hypothetical protein
MQGEEIPVLLNIKGDYVTGKFYIYKKYRSIRILTDELDLNITGIEDEHRFNLMVKKFKIEEINDLSTAYNDYMYKIPKEY